MKTRSLLLAATAAIALSAPACDELPSGDVTDPHTWGDHFLTKYEDELVVDELEPGPAPLQEPRVVLLITGVTIPGEWFDPMVARLERDGFIPVVYEPPELLSGDLFQNSVWLGEVVEQLVEETGQDKIDILAECTGGLIARHYVQSLGGDEYVSRMVTFISPQHGLDKAPLAADVAGWDALYDLSPGSEFLETVNSAPLPANVPFTSIYSCTDEYIQPYKTSIIPGAKNIGLCDGFVGHFEFFYNPDIYLIMHQALTEPVPGEQGGPPAAPEGGGESAEPQDSAGGDEAGGMGCSVGDASGGEGSSGGMLWMLGALGLVAARRRRAVRARRPGAGGCAQTAV